MGRFSVNVAPVARELADCGPENIKAFDARVKMAEEILGEWGLHNEYADLREQFAQALAACRDILEPIAVSAEYLERKHVNLALSGLENVVRTAQKLDITSMPQAIERAEEILSAVRNYTR